MRMYKIFTLISLVLLAVPLQVSENPISDYDFGKVKEINNFGDIIVAHSATADRDSSFAEIVPETTRPLLQLVDLALIEGNVLVVPCKVKVARCLQTVS